MLPIQIAMKFPSSTRKKQQVIQTVSLAPYRGAPAGSQPDALTVSADGKTLYAANSLNNDIAVISLGESGEKDQEARVEGLIPTAWYPTGVYLGQADKKLMVLNAKGLGAGPNGQNHQWLGNMIKGTMSFINVPDKQQLKTYTSQVNGNNRVKETEDNNSDKKKIFLSPASMARTVHLLSMLSMSLKRIKRTTTYSAIWARATAIRAWLCTARMLRLTTINSRINSLPLITFMPTRSERRRA